MVRIGLGDIVRLKKPHPCGGYEWEIVRVGADLRIKCLRCGHQVMVPRTKLEKRIKQVVPKSGGQEE
ncbi:MAG: DUF951 domain-containing protein [Clostridia bacterium]|nr:DUF951 domain-containing protein [Clostridia bacterium]